MIMHVKTVGKKHEVFNGTALKTVGGLKKQHLTISKSSGKVVSKKKQAAGKRLAKKFPPLATKAPNFR